MMRNKWEQAEQHSLPKGVWSVIKTDDMAVIVNKVSLYCVLKKF